MITRDRPSPGVESIPEGIKSRTADVATRRVVNGVCGHGHDGVLMGGRATVKL